jgi:hypothetical protein
MALPIVRDVRTARTECEDELDMPQCLDARMQHDCIIAA